MCGITGLLHRPRDMSEEHLATTVERMATAIYNRGPDDSGVWVDPASGVALGHRRLSIVDLTPEGHQPKLSANGRYVLVFNGEIYNFQALRAELESLGHHFRGRSDTEVLLAAVTQWGVKAALQRFVGMFAFALWDRQEKQLTLARDRMGEKPLYYGWMGQTLLFGSQLKALKAYPGFRGEIDRNAVALYMRHSYIPAPYSIYRGVFKLPPGTFLVIDPADGPASSAPIPYWSMREVAEHGSQDLFKGSFDEAVSELDQLLREAVGLQMVADVPLGAFLSGGVDSSTVVSLMQAQSSRPVKTFSIGFNEAAYNEAEWAKAVAQHLGTDHTELYVTPDEARAVIPRLASLYDEPFSDSSQIPTFLVAQLARRHVTVCLSGDAGDELFGGYNRYTWGRGIWGKIGWMPHMLRRTAAGGLRALSPQQWDSLFLKLGPLMPSRLKQRNPGDKLHKLSAILGVRNSEEMYQDLVSHWEAPGSVVLGAREYPTALTDTRVWASLSDFTQRMMYLDTVSYLPDDILVKVDRATMGVALESRVPMLDHRVVEFAWKLPLSMKLARGSGKRVLREVLYKYVPKSLIERPKMGFAVPIDQWLRGPLKEWAEALLDEQRLRNEGYFDPEPVRQKWQEHISGKDNWQHHIWDVLMFQAWLDEAQKDAKVPAHSL